MISFLNRRIWSRAQTNSGYHLKNTNHDRDYTAEIVADVVMEAQAIPAQPVETS